MARTRLTGTRALALAVALLGSPGTLYAADHPRPAGCVTRYDIATRLDLLLAHLVAPATAGDVEEWSKTLLGGLPGQVGDWVTQYFDARTMASVITEAFPVEGQPALGPVDTLVADCARTLGVEKPAVYVRNNPFTRIYAVRAGGRDHLVLTSALLNLFEERPAELRFVIGRELGHIKCGHAELKRTSYAILSAVQAINAAVVPDRYQNVLPLLGLGRLFTWSREAEFSADRAGLLCCGEPKHGHFLKTLVRRVYSVDNSRRDVCNRGRDPLIGLDGASPHAHDPATHRQRFRRPLRSIRRRHRDGQGP